MSSDLKAVERLIDAEIGEYGHRCNIVEDDGEFEIDFPEVEGFNTIYIQVVDLDKNCPESSKFKVQVHDDAYEEFAYYDYTVKELWKALLWR